MPELKFKLSGWNAIVVLVLIAGFLAFRTHTRNQTLTTEATKELRFWLAAELVRKSLPDLKQAVDTGDREKTAKLVDGLKAGERLEFLSIDARGSAKDIVVRVELSVDAGPPPYGDPVRYFKMEHSLVSGWRMRWETSAWSYRLKLF